jgi:hypothetical protein
LNDLPTTHYAQSDDLNIAYQVMGEGSVDLVFVPGMITHLEFLHEIPGYTEFLRLLAGFARVATFDKSGQGLSDRASGVASLERAWTTSAPSWTRSALRAQRSSAAPRARRSASSSPLLTRSGRRT